MTFGNAEFDDLLRKIILNKKRHSTYQDCCDHAEEMSWHFYGVRPDELLDRARPNEEGNITKYRKENYEPITKSAADKSITITSKIFNPNLYSIRWEKGEQANKSADELKTYSLDYYPEYNSVVNYTKEVLLRKMLADPNAIVAVTTEPTEDENKRVKPVMKIYGSPSIWYYDEDHYLVNTGVEDDIIYYFDYYDKDMTISFTAYIKAEGANRRVIINEDKRYVYELETIPVWKLRGMSDSMDTGEVMFKSFFSAAVPYWNNAIIHESDVFAAYIRHLFPQRYELSETCQYKQDINGMLQKCSGGKLNDGSGGYINCPNCSGSGYQPISAYGVYRYSKDKLSDGTQMGIDPVGYINVPIDATKMLEERANSQIAKGMWAINMDIEDKVGEVQSGVAKVIDRSAQYDTLSTIAGVVFDIHLTNWFYYANALMFGVETIAKGNDKKEIDKNLPQINKPTHFDIASVTELVESFKASNDSGLDSNYLQMKQIEIQSRDLTTNPDLKMFTVMILELDPLPRMPSEDVDRNVSRGYIRKVDAVIHFNIKAFVERAIRENRDFAKLPREQQIAILEKYGQATITAAKSQIELPPDDETGGTGPTD
jgi:hypothetical protein